MKTRRNLLYVIGIDHYESADFTNLDNPVRDTQEVIRLLTERYGFELFPDPLFNANATKENIYQGFNQLMMQVEPEDNLIIYFSGHGRMHTVGCQGYWVPYEGTNSIGDFIENSVIKDFIERIKAKHIFLIADSCFSGTFLTQTRSSGNVNNYESLDKLVSRWMLASGSEEPVSDGTKGKHSPFAHYLIKFLSVNDNQYASVQEVIRYVSTMTEHNSRQHPMGAPIENIGHAGGQMVFVLNDEFVKSKKEKSRGVPSCHQLLEDIRAYESEEKRLPAGKEILLIESFLKEGGILITELFRFDDAGKKKHHFSDGALKIVSDNGEKSDWKVIRRFATWQGFTRYWDENKDAYNGKNPMVLGAHDSIDNVESSEAAVDYSYYLKDLFESNPEPMQCLHCGEMISTNDSSMVEIDEEGLRPSAGNVHNSCLRPLDRIIGKAVFPSGGIENLVSFDSKKWIGLLRHGQFHWLNALKASKGQPIWILTWNREHMVNSGEYCIRQTLDNGRIKYIRLGKEIQRFHSKQIDEELAFFKKELAESQAQGDPLAYTDKQFLFGRVSELEKRKDTDEKIVQVTNIEKVKYSRQIESENTGVQNDYAPVGLVVIPGTMQLVRFGNCIPIIFDPTQFEALHKNWNDVGYTIGPCAIKIVESDREFDLFLLTVLQDGMQPIVHPMFDKDKELISGTYIQDIRYFTEYNEMQEKEETYSLKENPDWKEGDTARVMFPGNKSQKVPEGIVLSDEFIDDRGESCVIFCPIENGKQLMDAAVKIPVKFLVGIRAEE
jgi:hypothetical protein